MILSIQVPEMPVHAPTVSSRFLVGSRLSGSPDGHMTAHTPVPAADYPKPTSSDIMMAKPIMAPAVAKSLKPCR